MFDSGDITALLLTIKLASVTTILLLLFGIPVAWWLARSNSRTKVIVEAMVALPLVLPPTVLGFYLLIIMGPQGPLAGILDYMGIRTLAFTFTGLVIGSFVYSMPFVVQPIHEGFVAIGRRPMEVAATLRSSPFNRFITIAIPMTKSSIITGAVLGFAHTIGEFGVVLMIGGNIPGETHVVSIAIFNHVEALEFSQAHSLSFFLVLFSFLRLVSVYVMKGKTKWLTA